MQRPVSHGPVRVNLLQPLQRYYGPAAFDSADQAAFVIDRWAAHLAGFPADVLAAAFDQIILTNKFPRWPTLAEVHSICVRLSAAATPHGRRGFCP